MIEKSALPSIIVAMLSLALGCGGGSTAADPVGPDSDADDPDICQVDAELAKTAKPKPTEKACIDGVSQMSDDCAGADGVACYQLSVCLAMAYMGRDEMSADRKAEVFAQMLETSGKACDDGIAQACLMRGGMIQEEIKESPGRADMATLEPQMCESYVRSCQLGGDCQSCTWSECGDE